MWITIRIRQIRRIRRIPQIRVRIRRVRVLKIAKFSYSNFVPEKKTTLKWTYKKHTYERSGRQIHSFRTQFLVLMFARILPKLYPIICSCISLWVFSYKFLQYFENIFF